MKLVRTLSEEDWDSILKRIAKGNCTPFLGAGASSQRIGVATDIAAHWADKYEYPLPDKNDLMRVAQFRAVTGDPVEPKEDMADLCRKAKPPDFSDVHEIHRVLADLPLKTYLTTNYDDFMFQALTAVRKKPRQEICRWNRHIQEQYNSIFDVEPLYAPDQSNPLVFHLHGCAYEPHSMVLTEDDYVDFLL